MSNDDDDDDAPTTKILKLKSFKVTLITLIINSIDTARLAPLSKFYMHIPYLFDSTRLVFFFDRANSIYLFSIHAS